MQHQELLIPNTAAAAVDVSCYTAREAVSNGILQGNNPINFALPLLVIQIVLVLCVTRTMAFLIKPLRQPRVLAEIIGGVMLGPSALGRFKPYLNTIFPKQSITTIDTVANFGLMFFLFMIGLELDLKDVRRSGKAAMLTALAGIALPFSAGIGMAAIIRQYLYPLATFGPLVVFLGVPFSITAFPVLVRIMAEKKILSTDLGRVVLPTAAINDVCAWIMLAVGVAITGTGGGRSAGALTPLYVILSCLAFVLIMMLFVKRLMEWVARRANAEDGTICEVHVCLTLVGVLISGFITDFIGIHPLFGPFVFGMVAPKQGRFAQAMTEKVEDFVNVLFLPLFFVSSGLKTNLTSINSAAAVIILAILVLVGTACKVSITAAAGLLQKMDLRTAFAFGFLMNTKGLVELIVLNIGKDIGVFDDQTFAMLIIMCLVMLAFTSPAVSALYKPRRAQVPYTNRKVAMSQGSDYTNKDNINSELRVLACLHTAKNVTGILNFIEACRGSSPTSSSPKPQLLKLFVMHLQQLTDRTSSLIGLINSLENHGSSSAAAEHNIEDNVLTPFKAYGRFTKLPVRLSTATSHIHDAHNDICRKAEEERTNIIILPFDFDCHKDGSIETVHHASRIMNQKVLEHAPCSVAVLFDKAGLWGSSELAPMIAANNSVTEPKVNVAVLFFGGANDREAVAVGQRMSMHAMVNMSIIRFRYDLRAAQQISIDINHNAVSPQAEDKRLDDECLLTLNTGSQPIIAYEEITYDDDSQVIKLALAKLKSNKFSLIIVGKEGMPHVDASHQICAAGHLHCTDHQLGVMGNALLTSPNCHDINTSLLVVQQHRPK